MNAINSGIVELLSSEIRPVYVNAIEICEGIRIIELILLEIVILEKNDVRECAVIAGGTCQSNCVLNIRGLGLLDDVQLEIWVYVLLVVSLSCLKCRDVEVLIPGIYGKGVCIL